ncbi:GntR family transcriptional regulator [Paramaledivibacter caminithermalis]|jgi:GntR family transcriptional regulator|uniref:GntR family transcriptional regulator n=1 Tax=Paramaledivibacter caminithermalis (strain DSM 15212 / CIP 107654 / DViRD3) TaxID=1121301 RepID=A0A1M6PIP5_PARC5|nr:GntR family transcriptional regulator [Paramaledivibacter caminithermalis]SHK07818.1 GntR family transcriptional regulator [Paramaledivibacter caminithermalis DSM 15212]
MSKIKKGDRVPLYYQLMDIIIEDIESGKYKENDKLPSERELCEIYDISRATVRQTIRELEKEGYIYKQHGKGTFVSPERFKQDLLKFYSFTEEMKKIGKIPSSKVLDFEIIQSDEKIAVKMEIGIGEKIYKFTRLRLADGKPIMLETSYIPYNRFEGISRNDLEEEAMYDIFTKRYNTVFTKAEESFQPVSTREDEAVLLKNQPGSPSMMIERITYEGDKIIEYTVGIARGDRFKYRVVLEK